MQTFLPYPDFLKSAQCLDRKRLNKQITECLQIHRAIRNPNYGWQNHPAVRMWRHWPCALVVYANNCANVWGNTHKSAQMLKEEHFADQDKYACDPFDMPPWFGNPEFHASHRSNLLRKDPLWYGQFGWTEGPDLPYVWPTNKEAK